LQYQTNNVVDGIWTERNFPGGDSAQYKDEVKIELNNIETQVSGPDNVDKVHSVDEIENLEITRLIVHLLMGG
jgi:homoaconitase/3-isopropylmalate dehydratase large subunit